MTEHSEAYLNGWCAHRDGMSVDDNPYNEKSQGYSHSQWMSGWCERCAALKHNGDLSIDWMIGV